MKSVVECGNSDALYEEGLRAKLILGNKISMEELFWLIFRNHLGGA